MLDFIVTVNINRTTKIRHRYCQLKELLLRKFEVIADVATYELQSPRKRLQSMIDCAIWVMNQLRNLISAVAFHLHEIDDHPSCINNLLHS